MAYAFKKLRYKILIPIVDVLGSVIFFPIKLFNRKPPKDPKSILVVRLDHIGDFVCTTPLFKNIKKIFPAASITVLVNSVSKDLAAINPDIDKIITFSSFYLSRGEKSSLVKGLARAIKDVKNIGFDLGIDPRGDLLSILIMWLGGVKYRTGYGITGGGFLLNKTYRYDESKHIVDRNLVLLEALDIPISSRSPEVYFSEKDKVSISANKAVVIHPFAGAKAKQWSQENFQKLIDRIKEIGHEAVVVGSKDDKGIFSNVIDMRGKLNLPQLAYLIKKTGFFIGLDSGPANIAAALNVPSVIICSGTNIPQLWIPNNPNVRFVYRDTECKPCGLKVCMKEKHECMDQITVEEIFDKFKEIACPTARESISGRRALGKMGQSPST